MADRDPVQARQDWALGIFLGALGLALAVILFLAYGADMRLRFPGLVASLLFVLYGIVIIGRAGLPRESDEAGRKRLGVVLLALGVWLALVGLTSVTEKDDLVTPVVVVVYISGFVTFVFGGWLALVSQDGD